MKLNTKVSILTASLLLAGLLFPLLSANVALGVPVPNIGCCTTEDGGGQCVGCPEGATCTSSEDFCNNENGFFDEGSCFMTTPEQCVVSLSRVTAAAWWSPALV